MAIDATTFDAASARAVQRESSYSPIVRSATEEPYDQPGEMSFLDFLDVVNPLQHIPIVGTIYRSLTGDTIKPAQQVMGGMLYGGPLGAVSSIFGAVVAQSTGKSIEGHAMAALGFDDPNNHGIAVASAAPAAATAAQVASASAPAAAAPPVQPAATAASAVAPAADATPALARAPAGGTVTAPRDAFTAAVGEHRPSRMPARDTILANTMQAKHAAARTAPTPGAAAAMAAANASQATSQPAPAAAGAEGAKPADGKPADGKSAAAPTPVPPEMLSDVMMRNLAKYEAAKKAAAVRTAPASVRVSG